MNQKLDPDVVIQYRWTVHSCYVDFLPNMEEKISVGLTKGAAEFTQLS